MTDKKVLPASLEAERAVIGSLLLDNSKLSEVRDLINADDFYYPETSIIFTAIEELAFNCKPVDPLTVSDCLDKKNWTQAETSVYEMTQEVPSSSNVLAYASIVRERSIFRQLIKISEDMQNDVVLATSDRQIKKCLNELETGVKNLMEEYKIL